ncbi:[protein-PII] uridylyltransferase [Reinekea blandensis]|uniref:Bifunctional uridylyltransferase/uridylyl-removing enzyme n=1 Tax=Reinekea blandensis MED297 TaxID=314283 RepID=A4BCF5_9GAMM|nr:[protein-PII] uridylyltransferase [Reinekea blandensis]EAR10221.1 PII uridylyl-transferase [Reinekea sp. MED297] [Reinekea blandensis MED297]
MDLADYSDHGLVDQDTLKAELSQGSPIPVLKRTLADLQKQLNQRFIQGEPIRNLVFGRAWALDQILQTVWQQFSWRHEDDIALIAVGGYGRGELLPRSDIDLLLLFSEEATINDNVDSLQAFITLLWDIKLEVGHSVRTLDACIQEAADDVTITTNLMETRTLVGPSRLREQLLEAVGPDRIWPSKDFYKAKMNEQANRYQKFNDTEYNLEPNVKGGPGALRDIQTIGWVAKRHFGDTELRELVERNFLTDAEFQDLNHGQDFLWRVRYALHMITGREEDRLLFNLQEEVAEMFGYSDREGQLAVEHLMQDYFRQVFKLRTLNIILLQLFDEAILSEHIDDQITPINGRFQIRNQYIEVTADNVFNRTPSALLEIFVLCAQTEGIKGIRASTMRLLFASRNLIDGAFRQDLRNITFFMELLRSPQGVYHGLLRMNQYGILGLYLPEFGRIVGQMQFDLFHVYTVDAHTLLTIRNLRSFRHSSNTKRFPIATKIIHKLPKIELAYIAALYHDIGKGRNSDHSQEGALEVHRFAQRHRLSNWESDLVVWLVQHHLLMSMTAQRQDISDPAVINRFAQQVGDQQRLDYLYVLTVADIFATNPNLWNGWRASLMERLYHETKRALRRGLENPINKEDRIAETKEAALLLLTEDGFEREDVLALWDNPGDDYFLRETPENIAWHTRAIANHGINIPLVLIKETNVREYAGGTQLFIYAPDRAHLFADIAATLDALNLDIQDARIMTSSASHFSLDTFIVLEQDGTSIGDNPDRLFEIQHKLLLEIQNPNDTQPPKRRISRQLKHFQIPAEITVSNDMVNHRTVVEVVASDRPGLLADIGRCFRRLELTLLNARISTLGEHVEDVFFLVDRQGLPLMNSSDVERLQNELKSTISEAMDR